MSACGIPQVNGSSNTANRTGYGPAALTAGSTPNGPAATAKYAMNAKAKKLIGRLRGLVAVIRAGGSSNPGGIDDMDLELRHDRIGLLSADDGGNKAMDSSL